MSARDNDEYPSDERQQDYEDSRRRGRLWHWCSTCHGHTGPGSPCAIDEPEEEQNDSPYCECNAEPTVSELEDGRCDACGKAIA